MPGKDLYWVGSSLDDLRAFPEEARREAGHQLHLVQIGLEPSDWKAMPTVGAGVYVLHAFEKKTQRTAKADLERGQQRLRDVLAERRERAAQSKRERSP